MIPIKGISWKDALKVMGLKRGFSKAQLRKRYLALAKKKHPDLMPPKLQKASTIEFQKLEEAYRLLKQPPEMSKGRILTNVRPYYNLLRRNIPVDATPEDVDLIFAKIVKQKRFKSIDQEQRLTQAAEILAKEVEDIRAYKGLCKTKIRKRLQKRFQYNIMSPEEKEIVDLQEKAQNIIIKEYWKGVFNNFKKLVRRAVYIRKRPHVAIKVKAKKSHKKHVLLTASLLVAILGGKYIWDKVYRAYTLRRSAKYPLVKT